MILSWLMTPHPIPQLMWPFHLVKLILSWLTHTPPTSPRWHDTSIWWNCHSPRSDAPSQRWHPNSPRWEPHTHRKQPHSTKTLHLNRLPPIPPMPIHYQETSIKDLERKDKQIKKSIPSLEEQLNELMFEKAHIQSCLDYFQTDQDNFMQAVENYHSPSTPPSSPPSSPSDRSPTPLPIPPRPSFLQSMATSLLLSIPADNTWSWCDCSYHTYTLHYSSAGNGRINECNNDPPHPESVSLFGCRTPSPPPHPRPPPDSPYTPRKPQNPNNPTYRHQCLCYDCVHGSGCGW